MKKIIRTILVISAMTMMFAMPANAAVKTSVKVLNVGKSYTISSASKVTSSKKSVATAKKKSGSKYKITAKKKGVATLKVYNKKGKQTKKIYLLATNSSSFKYSTSTVNMKKGETKTVKGTSNISGVTVKYSSSNSNVATVNSNGKITAKKAGSATISAKFYYKGIKAKTLKKTVNVYTSSYDTSAISLTEGKTKTVSASISSNCTAKYSSSDTKVATVSSSGKITAVKKGVATITCKVYLGNTNVKTYTKKVTVNASTSTASSTSSSSSSTSSSSSSSSSSGSSSSSSSSGSSSSSSSSGSSSSSSFIYHTSRGSDSLSGGKKSTVEVYCENASDVVTFTFSNDCLEFTGMTIGTCRDDLNHVETAYYTRIAYVGRKTGICNLDIYVNNKYLETVSVTVTSTDENYYIYQEWKQNMKDEIWTDAMTNREKIDAAATYVRTHCVYIADQSGYMGLAVYGGGNCIAQADFVIDLAHDLGLEAEEYLVEGSYLGHVYAIVYYEPGVGTKVDIALS